MIIKEGMYVPTKDEILREIFLTLCEAQGINWRSGSKPRQFVANRQYLIVTDFFTKVESDLEILGTDDFSEYFISEPKEFSISD
jgi:hypothetical protein